MGEIRLKRGLEKQEGRERHENKVDGWVGFVQSHEGRREWGILMIMHMGWW